MKISNFFIILLLVILKSFDLNAAAHGVPYSEEAIRYWKLNPTQQRAIESRISQDTKNLAGQLTQDLAKSINNKDLSQFERLLKVITRNSEVPLTGPVLLKVIYAGRQGKGSKIDLKSFIALLDYTLNKQDILKDPSADKEHILRFYLENPEKFEELYDDYADLKPEQKFKESFKVFALDKLNKEAEELEKNKKQEDGKIHN